MEYIVDSYNFMNIIRIPMESVYQIPQKIIAETHGLLYVGDI